MNNMIECSWISDIFIADRQEILELYYLNQL